VQRSLRSAAQRFRGWPFIPAKEWDRVLYQELLEP
jgi:hypothetical protein